METVRAVLPRRYGWHEGSPDDDSTLVHYGPGECTIPLAMYEGLQRERVPVLALATVDETGQIDAGGAEVETHTPPAPDLQEEDQLSIYPVIETPIPASFPGGEALQEAGYTTLETVPRDVDALVSLPKIGKVTAGRILEALAEEDQ